MNIDPEILSDTYEGIIQFIIKGYAVQDGLRLIKQYYDYAPQEEHCLIGIIHGTARIPMLIEMNCKMIAEGCVYRRIS